MGGDYGYSNPSFGMSQQANQYTNGYVQQAGGQAAQAQAYRTTSATSGGGMGTHSASYQPPPPPLSPYQQSFNQALGLAQGMYGPQQTALQGQAATMQGNMGIQQAAYSQQAGAANQQYQAQLAMINHQQAGQQIDYDAIARQMGYYNQVGAAQDGRTQQQLSLNTLMGQLSGRDNAGDMLYQNAMQDIVNGTLQNDLTMLSTQADRTRTQSERDKSLAQSDAISRGAFQTKGTGDDFQFIADSLKMDLADIVQQKSKAKHGALAQTAGITTAKGHLEVDKERNAAQTADNQNSLLYDQTMNHLSNAEQQARLGDRQKQLDHQAQQYGLEANALAANLSNTLAQLNLQGAMSVGQVLDNLSSNNVQQAAVATQIMQMALQYQPQLAQQ